MSRAHVGLKIVAIADADRGDERGEEPGRDLDGRPGSTSVACQPTNAVAIRSTSSTPVAVTTPLTVITAVGGGGRPTGETVSGAGSTWPGGAPQPACRCAVGTAARSKALSVRAGLDVRTGASGGNGRNLDRKPTTPRPAKGYTDQPVS